MILLSIALCFSHIKTQTPVTGAATEVPKFIGVSFVDKAAKIDLAAAGVATAFTDATAGNNLDVTHLIANHGFAVDTTGEYLIE